MKLGFYSETIFVPLLVFVVVAVVTYVIIRNLLLNIYRADRAEEMVRLQQEIDFYQRQQQLQKEQLSKGIQLIADVHADVANGNFRARVPLDTLGSNSPVWAVAVGLNNLLNRVQTWRQEAQFYGQSGIHTHYQD